VSRQQQTRIDSQTSTHAKPTRPSDLPPLESIHYFIDGFLLKHRSQRHSPRTVEFYKEHLSRFVWFLEHEAYPSTLDSITPNHIRHFLIYLSQQKRWESSAWNANKPLSARTIHAYARALRAFFRWATKEAPLSRNPFENVDMPRVPGQWKVEAFTDEEIVTLFATIDKSGTPFTVQRNRTILAVLLDSGIRASELLGLDVDDVDPRESMFNVKGKGGKSRPAVVGGFARRELWAYLTHFRLKMVAHSRALFLTERGTPLSYDGLMQMFRKLRIKSGIDRVSVRPHICRHTFATKAHRNGMRGSTLQEVLGHSLFDTTRRYYLDISREDLAAEHALYGPLDKLSRDLRPMRESSSPANRPVLDENGRFVPKLPEAHVLAREVAQSSYLAVARKYGVSDTAVRKRLKKAGLLK
jgi:integrase/recombinase XerD